MSLKIDFAKEIAKLIKRTRKMLEKRDSEINRYELTKTANIEVPSSNSELDILSDEQIVEIEKKINKLTRKIEKLNSNLKNLERKLETEKNTKQITKIRENIEVNNAELMDSMTKKRELDHELEKISKRKLFVKSKFGSDIYTE